MKKKLLMVLCLVLAISLTACDKATDNSTPEPGDLADTWTGRADGYGGVITAVVTLDGDTIVDLEVGHGSETVGIGTAAIDQLVPAIIEAGTVDGVDLVAGATVTSNAVIAAVQNAIDPVAFPYVEKDAIASASPKESSNPEDLIAGLSADGYWIFSLLSDVTTDREIIVDGTFHSKDDTSADVYRKLALYAQDSERNVTASYTLTAPKMTVNSPNFRIQEGTFKGNIYVAEAGFELVNTTVEGDVVFASEELMNSADIERATITGSVAVGEGVDAVAHASPKESSDPKALVSAMAEDGFWIFSLLGDVTLSEELVVEGTFYNKDDTESNVYRKLALYAQDAEKNVTAHYTLTLPQLTVNSPNFRIQNGVVKGDVYVNAEGFELVNTVIEGNLIFATEALQEAADIERGTVNGTVSVG